MNQEASFTFTTPLNVNLIEIKGEEHLFVEGDISTNDIDLVDDIMTKHCQESMQKQILERNMKLDLEHEAFKGETHEEKEINKTKIPAGKLINATVKDLGSERFSTRVQGEINRFNPNYKNIKGNLLDGYLDAFSVAFLPIDITHEQKDGKKIRLLNDVTLLNVALTGNPCNTKAQLTDIVTKSMDAVEEYKKLKDLDPDIEKSLIVKSKDKKENPLSSVLNKIYCGQEINSKEKKLLKAAMDVAENKGKFGELVKEIYDKIIAGEKLSYKEFWVFKELLEIDHSNEEIQEMPVLLNKNHKSHSTDLVGNPKLNKNKNKKMTDKDNEPTGEGEGEGNEPDKNPEGNESTDAENKAMFKSVTEEMKTLSDKYDTVSKENVGLKEDMKVISENLAKITEALANPIHKSPGIHPKDAENKANAEGKSVDPLDACN